MEVNVHQVEPADRRGIEDYVVSVYGAGLWPWTVRFSYVGSSPTPGLVGMELSQEWRFDGDGHREGCEELTVSGLRSLPLSRWERAARAALVPVIEARDEPIRRRMRAMTERAERLLAEVERVCPELVDAPHSDKAARRRFETAMKLAAVADEYRSFLAAGLADPVAAIARKIPISNSAARTLVYRARKEGFLGPARGPTAGEAVRTEEGGGEDEEKGEG